ncbi:PrgI family protein (plasmid) [Lysinibacillus fusiformis]|nr:PrgI family protein [Lysinibacillus fusiformis]
MRMAKVPIDMSSEQKNLFGVVSTRQAIYLVAGGSIIYSYVYPMAELLFPIFGWFVTLIICICSALPVLAFVGFFGFFPVSKYNMNRDYYMLIKWQRGSNVGLWRK